jgi:hypothetical protein
MAFAGHGYYVVVVLLVGGSKASNIKLVLHHELRSGKAWFSAGSILPNEEHVDAAIRELFKETCFTLTVDNFTLLSSNHVRVPLQIGRHKLVYIFAASVPVHCVTANLRTPAKVEQAVIAQSTFHHDGTYVVPSTINIDGLYLTPSKKGLRKFELLHFGYVAHWEAFRGAVISRQFFFFTRFTAADYGRVWMLIKGYTN